MPDNGRSDTGTRRPPHGRNLKARPLPRHMKRETRNAPAGVSNATVTSDSVSPAGPGLSMKLAPPGGLTDSRLTRRLTRSAPSSAHSDGHPAGCQRAELQVLPLQLSAAPSAFVAWSPRYP
jgi:hypothetical protein